MSTFPLPLPGWDHHSVWGWDPMLNCLYVQLYRNGNNPDESDDGPDMWLMPPDVNTLYVEDLAAAIAAAVNIPSREVRRALGERLDDELFTSG